VKSSEHRNPRRRAVHFLTADGAVACNPRDREAARRAESDLKATEDPKGVTCRKCLEALRRTGSGRGRAAGER
jgi:hypothetical protein